MVVAYLQAQVGPLRRAILSTTAVERDTKGDNRTSILVTGSDVVVFTTTYSGVGFAQKKSPPQCERGEAAAVDDNGKNNEKKVRKGWYFGQF